MKWLPLSLSAVNEIDKQAEESINTLRALCDQFNNAVNNNAKSTSVTSKATIPAQVNKAITVLRQAMSTRIQALDAFYRDNDLDPRAAKLESTRLRMKKALRDLDVDHQQQQGPSSSSEQQQQQRQQQQQHNNGSSAVAHQSPTNATNNNNNEMVAVRILMTPQEYEELRRRRDVMRNAHVRSQEYVGGATMSMNNINNNNHTTNRVSSASRHGVANGGGSLSWEHAAEIAQKRNLSSKLSPPIVRASGQYLTGNVDEDPRMQLGRSRGGGTRLSMGPGAGSGHGQSFSQIQSQVVMNSSSSGRMKSGGGSSPRTATTAPQTQFGNYQEQNMIRNPNVLQGYRYQSPRVAATGGARSVANTYSNNNNNSSSLGRGRNGAWSSAGVFGTGTDQLDKMRGFGAR